MYNGSPIWRPQIFRKKKFLRFVYREFEISAKKIWPWLLALLPGFVSLRQSGALGSLRLTLSRWPGSLWTTHSERHPLGRSVTVIWDRLISTYLHRPGILCHLLLVRSPRLGTESILPSSLLSWAFTQVAVTRDARDLLDDVFAHA